MDIFSCRSFCLYIGINESQELITELSKVNPEQYPKLTELKSKLIKEFEYEKERAKKETDRIKVRRNGCNYFCLEI